MVLSQTFAVTVTAPATGTLTNILASTPPRPTRIPRNNDGSAPGSRVTTTIIEVADVATSKTGPATVDRGHQLQLRDHGTEHRAVGRGQAWW